ncbi:MAG: hypothetical protein EOO11_23550 [Chitinophagaceae bacterium]|nr:MAG: hypothetical protein EOO11_23550 [Chitinophagaceae bacterium]
MEGRTPARPGRHTAGPDHRRHRTVLGGAVRPPENRNVQLPDRAIKGRRQGISPACILCYLPRVNFPWTIHIGSAAIPAHALFETAAFFTGFRYFLFLRRRKGDNFDSQQRGWIILGALFGALAGSRLLGALEQPVQWAQSPHPWLYLYANKTVLGGFLGGLFGVEAVKKLIGERRASGDLFVYPMLLALIIGRIGCF